MPDLGFEQWPYCSYYVLYYSFFSNPPAYLILMITPSKIEKATVICGVLRLEHVVQTPAQPSQKKETKYENEIKSMT